MRLLGIVGRPGVSWGNKTDRLGKETFQVGIYTSSGNLKDQ